MMDGRRTFHQFHRVDSLLLTLATSSSHDDDDDDDDDDDCYGEY